MTNCCTPPTLNTPDSPQNQSQLGFPLLILPTQKRLPSLGQRSPSPMPRLLLADSFHPGPRIWLSLIPARRNLQENQKIICLNFIENSYFRGKLIFSESSGDSTVRQYQRVKEHPLYLQGDNDTGCSDSVDDAIQSSQSTCQTHHIILHNSLNNLKQILVSLQILKPKAGGWKCTLLLSTLLNYLKPTFQLWIYIPLSLGSVE